MPLHDLLTDRAQICIGRVGRAGDKDAGARNDRSRNRRFQDRCHRGTPLNRGPHPNADRGREERYDAVVATWKQVSRIALALPETAEIHRGTMTWRVRDKLFVWERPLRPSDLRALGERAPRGAILGVRVESLVAKEARLAAPPDVLFTTPHFDGYPAVLIRLGKIKGCRPRGADRRSLACARPQALGEGLRWGGWS